MSGGDWGPGDFGGIGQGASRGAMDGDPIATVLFLFRLFVLLQWMGQPGGPLVDCQICQGNVAKFFSPGNQSTSWMIYLVMQLGFLMFATWLAEQVADEDEGKVGDFLRSAMFLSAQGRFRFGGAQNHGIVAREARAAVEVGPRRIRQRRERA